MLAARYSTQLRKRCQLPLSIHATHFNQLGMAFNVHASYGAVASERNLTRAPPASLQQCIHFTIATRLEVRESALGIQNSFVTAGQLHALVRSNRLVSTFASRCQVQGYSHEQPAPPFLGLNANKIINRHDAVRL